MVCSSGRAGNLVFTGRSLADRALVNPTRTFSPASRRRYKISSNPSCAPVTGCSSPVRAVGSEDQPPESYGLQNIYIQAAAKRLQFQETGWLPPNSSTPRTSLPRIMVRSSDRTHRGQGAAFGGGFFEHQIGNFRAPSMRNRPVTSNLAVLRNTTKPSGTRDANGVRRPRRSATCMASDDGHGTYAVSTSARAAFSHGLQLPWVV